MKRASFWILAVLLASGTARAQIDQAQLTRPQGVAQLNAYLARLGSNPRDVSALIGAGEAALALDDPNAAAGFFARADAIESGNGRIKAGLGKVMLQMRNPAEALRLFDQAGRLGYADANILPERGLARDMSGDQAGAQQDYRAALARTPGANDLVYRYAASLGISGQVEAAEHVLQPLLYKSDRAAWRYRAFILAMNNRQADAKKIAMQTLPENIAVGLIPYMQKMPYLTAAQKAAAVHFGHFPAQVGTQITKITPTPPVAVAGVVPAAAREPAVDVAAASTVPAPATRASRSSSRDRGQRPGSMITRAPTRMAQAATQAPVPAVAQPAAPAQTAAPSAPAATPAPVRPAMIQPIPQPAAQTPTRNSVASAASASPAASPPPTASASAAPFPASTVFPVPTANPSASAQARQGPPSNGLAQADPRATAPSVAPVATRPTPADSLNAISLAQASVPRTAIPANAPPAQNTPAPSSTPQSSSGVSAVSAVPVAPSTAATVQPLPPSSPASAQAAPTPSAATASAQPSPPSASVAPPTPVVPRSLAEIIRAIDVPDAERRTTVAAVNLDEIVALQAARRAEQQAAVEKAKKAADAKAKAAEAKAKADADAKAKKEAEEKARLAANPARSWVQIGMGANRAALPFTLKQLRGKYAEIAQQDAWSASWGRTNRLLIGPFPSFTRAKAVEQSLKAKGADVFAWRSEAGETVERLGGS